MNVRKGNLDGRKSKFLEQEIEPGFVLYFPTLLNTYYLEYVAEQGFNQVLHMRNKYRNRPDMNKLNTI